MHRSAAGVILPAAKTDVAQEGLLLAFGSFVAGILILMLVIKRPWGIVSYLLLLIAILVTAVAARLAYRSYALMRLRYQINRDAVFIYWGWSRYTLPLPNIEGIRAQRTPEIEPPLSRWQAIWRWPAAFVGRTLTANGPVFVLASQPTPQQLLLEVNRGIPCALSPADPEAFLQTLSIRHHLGPNRRLEAGFSAPVLWRAPLLHDRLALSLLLTGWLLLFGLLTYLTWHWPAAQWSQEQRALLLIAAIISLVNSVAGLLLYALQRWESYLLWSATVLINGIAFMALFLIPG